MAGEESEKKQELKQLFYRAGPFRIGIVLLCGIVLLLISCGESFSGRKDETDTGNREVVTELDQYRADTKEELIRLLNQVDGVGKVQVMLNLENREDEPEVVGVAIVCEGGDNVAVKREITEAVSALFQLESHKIKVMKSKEAKE